MAPEPSSQQLEAKSLELSELLDKSTSSSATTAGLEPGSLVLNEATDQQVCARLCSLMKAQLVKAHEEVIIRIFIFGLLPVLPCNERNFIRPFR